jgi:hypothetical protein
MKHINVTIEVPEGDKCISDEDQCDFLKELGDGIPREKRFWCSIFKKVLKINVGKKQVFDLPCKYCL